MLFGLPAASPGALSARFFFDGQSSTDVTSIFDSGPGFNDAGTLVGVRSGNGVAVDVFRFTVGDLSGPPNAVLGQLQGLGSRVFASNNNGAHAGAEGSINGYRAIVFNEPNQVTQLGTLGGDTSIAQAINDSGSVVGVSKTGETSSKSLLVLLPKKHSCTITVFWLDWERSADEQHRAPINEHGQVVGESSLANWQSHAFLYDTNGGMRDIGPPSVSSIAYDINDFGIVAGQQLDRLEYFLQKHFCTMRPMESDS